MKGMPGDPGLKSILVMAVTGLQTLEIIEVMEAFLGRKRPPEHIRWRGHTVHTRGIFLSSVFYICR